MAVIAAAFLAMMLAGCSSDDNGAMMEEPMMPPVEETMDEPDEPMVDEPPEPEVPPAIQTTEGEAGRAHARRIFQSVTPNMATRPRSTGFAGGVSIMKLEQITLVNLLHGDPLKVTLSVAGQSDLATGGTGVDGMSERVSVGGQNWYRTDLMKMGPGDATQTAAVYTDAQPANERFRDAYPYNRDDMNALGQTHRYVIMGPAAATPVSDLDDGKISFEHGLSTTGDMTEDYAAADLLRGTYNGISGEYTCYTTDCTLALNLDGMLTLFQNGGALLFQADDPNDYLQDDDYVAFGVWMQVPSMASDANPGAIRAFSKGSTPMYTQMQLYTLQGAASYKGPAAGHYATRARTDHMVGMGQFTANATIAVNFDGAMAAAFAGSKIDGFMTDDGTAMPGWVVLLGGADIGMTGMVSGATSGSPGGVQWMGNWDGSFHGKSRDDADRYPSGIAGRFHAEVGTPQPVTSPEGVILEFEDRGFTSVVGAFGANDGE